MKHFIENALAAIAITLVGIFTALFAFGILLIALMPVWIAIIVSFVIYKLLT